MEEYLTWLGIALCLSQSAMFSGLNLAYFSISRLRLEIAVANGDGAAAQILTVRKDSNFLLTTLLWGNVGINVLLTLLSDSVMTGLSAFIFSTFLITLGGEIAPQAYFSRNALRMASLLTPLVRFYQLLLYVVAKPSALVLDLWLGKEGIQYYREHELRQLIHKHIDAANTDVDAVEGIGALNFLAIDDVRAVDEGETVDADSIFQFPMAGREPQFFAAGAEPQMTQQNLARRMAATRHQWIILVDEEGEPVWVLDADAYLRAVFSAGDEIVEPMQFCHEPIIVSDPKTRVGSIISWFKTDDSATSDAPLKRDVILLWCEHKRIITGADILGRLFKGIGLYSSIAQSDP